MDLLPGWGLRLAQVDFEVLPSPRAIALPRCPSYHAGRITYVDTAAGAKAMANLARERAIDFIGIDAEFKHDRPGVVIDKDRTKYDSRSIHPLILSLAMAETGGGGEGRLYRFVVDLRRPEVLPDLRVVLGVPCRFIGHFTQVELFCLWRLGLDEPGSIWDTWAAEKAGRLGLHHRKYRTRADDPEAVKVCAAEEAERRDRDRLTLVATCERHGVEYPFAAGKERISQSFLAHPDRAPFTTEQIEYASADAVAAAQLYLPQVVRGASRGFASHLENVEMRWGLTNARMAWTGFLVDPAKRAMIAAASRRHLLDLLPRLASEGVFNVKSFPQLKAYFRRKGVLEVFRSGKGYSFDRDQLDTYKNCDPAIALIRATRRALDLVSDRLISGVFEGADGRVHPDLRQLGADTGRQASRHPNILGLGKVFRPLIVPGPGRGIGEVDLSQIEVGIAGAVYGDERLVAMFNSGDVYSAMALEFYRDGLSEEDRRLDSRTFKARHPALRDRMKVFTLSLIYGVTAYGLALQLGVTPARAAEMLGQFMAMFPTLERAVEEERTFGGRRGHASTCTGLRRYRANLTNLPSSWERNWLANHPVQGSACIAFKMAGNRLDRLYLRHDARLIIGLHDAYVYEAPLEALATVGRMTKRAMVEAVEELFPALRPDATINDLHPECWNKDGRTDSIERWVDDPTFSL